MERDPKTDANREAPSQQTRRREPTAPATGGGLTGLLTRLGQTGGNAAVSRLLSRSGDVAARGTGLPEVGPEGGLLSSALSERIHASRGSGSALGAETRRDMEQAFNTRFGAVTVHTDSEADALNRSVGAVAFTTGSDIYFSAGSYQPGTAGGDQLLAHELAHVAQHRGAADPGGDRLVVSAAGDTHEREAEAASAQVAGSLMRRQAPGGTPRGPGNSAATIHRAHEKALPQWGSASKPTRSRIRYEDSFATVEQNDAAGAHVGPPGNDQAKFTSTPQEQTITLQEGTAGGSVSFLVTADWFEHNFAFDDKGNASYKVRVPFTLATDNTLQWGSPIVLDQSSSGSGAALIMPVPVSTGASPSDGYVSISPTISGSESTSHQAGGAAGAGPFTISVPYAQTTTANITNAYTASYTLKLRPTPPKPITIPSVFFKVGSSTLEDGNEANIAQNLLKLPPAVLTAIRQGKRTIVIEGYASTTAKHKTNRELSQQRAQVVQNVLKGLVGDKADFNILYYGKETALAAGEPDEKEDMEKRRTDISVKAQPPK